MERPRRIVQTGLEPAPAPGLTPGRSGVPAARPSPRERYRPRGQRLRDAVARLDAGLDEHACRQLARSIGEEYEAEHGAAPLGFFARCRLGPPYVDHQLDLFGVVVRHFARSDGVPEPFAGARTLVRSGGYAYVEVYSDGLLIPVLDDGTAVRSGTPD
ncbi:hypothetical protein ABT039_39090 [Streptomyces lasiicapitis]|uniref:hypothetical protein n=1 Tax=Streptomyces lasiicapitis TaxID=1923961 RepID=UPI003327A481